jgi:hypothetical protein
MTDSRSIRPRAMAICRLIISSFTFTDVTSASIAAVLAVDPPNLSIAVPTIFVEVVLRGARSVDSLCCFAGIVPRTTQSGGRDQPACQGHTPARCNHILKDWTVQSAQKIHLYGPPNSRNASPDGMPTVSTASMRQHAATCVCCARWSSTRSPISIPEVDRVWPPIKTAPMPLCQPGTSSPASGAPSPKASLSLPRKQLHWAFGDAWLWSPALFTFPCSHEDFPAATNLFALQPGLLQSTPHAEMKTGDGATGWLFARCRALRDGLGQYAKTPAAPIRPRQSLRASDHGLKILCPGIRCRGRVTPVCQEKGDDSLLP